jgi:mRNA-degrading endonuclease toxin of MazEF toxin-antitoxin module
LSDQHECKSGSRDPSFTLNKSQFHKPSDILIDQIRVIDNKRFIKRLGELTKEQKEKIEREFENYS